MEKKMFMRLVLQLSNQTFVRHWMHWNYPVTPQLMAIAIIDDRDMQRLDDELTSKGFQFVDGYDFKLWTIPLQESQNP